jgi:hypothetical protein
MKPRPNIIKHYLSLRSLFYLAAACAVAAPSLAIAKAAAPKPAKAKIASATKPQISAKAGTFAAVSRAPAAVDPNHAVEIRGQSRTLSMMLVLKNGKENINFIRVRKDYNAEIRATEF